ncbi:MAG: YeaH/YhbH family protein [Legionellales bacterium]|nr:YeaH/YhbH family protein [Legionellales bacterium]
MSQIIDRRLNGKNKNIVNRQRFIRRFKQQIKKAVEDAVSKRSITDIENGEKIIIPKRDLSEPFIHHTNGGKREVIHPGNKEFNSGDRVSRPDGGGGAGGGGGDASQDGEGEDNFGFEISREEFLELFFEDMELPDLIKQKIARIPSYKYVRAGYTTSGIPSNINIVRSMRSAQARRIALGSPYKKQLKEAETELEQLEKTNGDIALIEALKQKIASLKKKIIAVPYIDEIDLRYNNRIKLPRPTTQAVMFCIMDVSGSMDEMKKDIAKRFFILLYLFLTRNYERIELVFIRHHTSAKETDEQEFFYSRETGGTVVSSALELMKKIMDDRYSPSEWNIYAAQASDGDNWNADSPYCRDLLQKDIIPLVQYFAYVEIMPRHHQSLWEAYKQLDERFDNFAMQKIDNRSEIFPVLHELFKRQPA